MPLLERAPRQLQVGLWWFGGLWHHCGASVGAPPCPGSLPVPLPSPLEIMEILELSLNNGQNFLGKHNERKCLMNAMHFSHHSYPLPPLLHWD